MKNLLLSISSLAFFGVSTPVLATDFSCETTPTEINQAVDIFFRTLGDEATSGAEDAILDDLIAYFAISPEFHEKVMTIDSQDPEVMKHTVMVYFYKYCKFSE